MTACKNAALVRGVILSLLLTENATEYNALMLSVAEVREGNRDLK